VKAQFMLFVFFHHLTPKLSVYQAKAVRFMIIAANF